VDEASKDDIFTLLHNDYRLNKMTFANSSIVDNSNLEFFLSDEWKL